MNALMYMFPYLNPHKFPLAHILQKKRIAPKIAAKIASVNGPLKLRARSTTAGAAPKSRIRNVKIIEMQKAS